MAVTSPARKPRVDVPTMNSPLFIYPATVFCFAYRAPCTRPRMGAPKSRPAWDADPPPPRPPPAGSELSRAQAVPPSRADPRGPDGDHCTTTGGRGAAPARPTRPPATRPPQPNPSADDCHEGGACRLPGAPSAAWCGARGARTGTRWEQDQGGGRPSGQCHILPSSLLWLAVPPVFWFM